MTDKDYRTYVRIHDGMPDHPKVDGLSDAAFRLLVTLWCWCSRHLTDGAIPPAVWRKRADAAVRDELVEVGLVDVTEDGSVQMHDYTQHQRTAEEVQAIREARSESGAVGNHKRWHVDRGVVDPNCDRCCDGKAVAKLSQRRSQNDRKTSPETETETDKGKDLRRFAEFWTLYPRKVGKPAAAKAWAATLKRGVDPAYLIKTTERFAELSVDTDVKFIPHPTTWLNQERYNDVDMKPATSPAPRRYPPTEVPDWLDPDDAEGYAKWMREATQ